MSATENPSSPPTQPAPAGAAALGAHPGISDEDWADLKALGEQIADAENSPWQPRCIAEAFANDANAPAPRFVLTMQRWINLDRVRSPVLDFKCPESIDDLEKALRAFDYMGESELTVQEWADLAWEMVKAAMRGFSTALGMQPKEVEGSKERDGFGSWAPMFSCLVTQVGMTPQDARALPVEQAHILIASMRRNQGWVEVGTPYALRDIGDGEDVKAETGKEGAHA